MQHEQWPRLQWRWLDSVQLSTVVLVALALIPTGAHLAELPTKLGLSHADYMTVQSLYSGWALFGVVIVGALALTALHTHLVRANRAAFAWSAFAFCCIAGTQVIFWLFTYPMNVSTENWTVMPPDLSAARAQWEYSHAASAGLNLVALVAAVMSVLASRPFVSARVLGAIERDIEARVARTYADHIRSDGPARMSSSAVDSLSWNTFGRTPLSFRPPIMHHPVPS
jgi:hypothetical protein